MILAVVWLLVVGGAAIGAQQPQPTPATGDVSEAPREATLLDPADLVIFSTGEVKGALAPGG